MRPVKLVTAVLVVTLLVVTLLIVACASMASPTPTLEPTLEPLASLFNINPKRVRSIEYPLPSGFEHAILTGCHAWHVDATTFAFSKTGELPTDVGDGYLSSVIIIIGRFPNLAPNGCYEMVVERTGTGNYELNSSVPVQIREYKLVDYNEGVRRIK